MQARTVPQDVADAIVESWPDGIMEEFDSDESYFYDIREGLERDLLRIRDVAVRWQTSEPDYERYWGDDDELPPEYEFESYRMYFLAPQGDKFKFDTETDSQEIAEEEPFEEVTVKVAGHGWYGCNIAISLVSPFAVLNFSEFAEFEDVSEPIIETFACSIEEAAQVKELGPEELAKLEKLRNAIARVLKKHHLTLLEPGILDMPVPDLRADGDVFLEPPLVVGDAFFFRGV
jgi:hypothetical protein